MAPKFRLVPLLLLAGLCACQPPPPPPPPPAPVVAAPSKPAPPAVAKPGPKPLLVAPPGATQIAVLLPLSGNAATIGNAMLNAAQLALFELGAPELSLLPFDSKGTAEGAQEAAHQAIARHVDVIVGPVFAAEARAVGPIAAAAKVPVLSLSADRSVAGRGTYVLGFLPGPQAVAVASFAANFGKLHQAVLAPGNEYGRTVVQDLFNTKLPFGVVIGPVEYYDVNALDLSSALKRLMGSHKPEDPGFDALFLPDEGQRLRRVGEQWTQLGVDQSKVVLLGTMVWDDSRVGDQPALAGALYAAAPTLGFADFSRRYAKSFSAPPPRLASLAYDATAMVAVLAKHSQHDFSVGILANPQGFNGVDGLFRLNPDGTVDRAYAIKEVVPGGASKEIQPAAPSFGG